MQERGWNASWWLKKGTIGCRERRGVMFDFHGAGAWRWLQCVGGANASTALFPFGRLSFLSSVWLWRWPNVALVWSCHPKCQMPNAKYTMALPAPAQQKPAYLRQGPFSPPSFLPPPSPFSFTANALTHHLTLPTSIAYPNPPSPHGLGTRRDSQM